MENPREEMHAFSKPETRRRMLAAGAVLLLVALVVALCISINMRANIQREYTDARNKAGEALYSNLYILMQTFDMTSVPNTDFQNGILPRMREYYTASITLNSLLSQTYGPKYAVLTDADINDLENAFSDYEKAYESGASTDLAQSNMQLCMGRIKELLSSRYSQGVLKAGR